MDKALFRQNRIPTDEELKETNKLNEFAEPIMEMISRKMRQTTDDILIEGLNRKGFMFCNMAEVEAFVREHCTCTNNRIDKVRTYYVKGIPFLIYDYSIEWDMKFEEKDHAIKASFVTRHKYI